MSDYKVVPLEPTAEMIEAAKDAYMPFGDMDLAIRMALLAAPAVQGEPVATIHVDGSFVHVAWRIPAPSRCAMDVYTAPQPAEQQPTPDVAALVEALRRIAALPIDPCSTENDYRLSAAKAIAAGVLADHRKQQEGEA